MLAARTLLTVAVVLAAEPLRETSTAQESCRETSNSIRPLDGCAWLGDDGIRAAWLGYKLVDDEMVSHLNRARVNSVFLAHQFQDLLDLETARWEAGTLVVDPREHTLQRLIANTQRAAQSGIHVFWLANYELEHMLPHLKRLGYQSALTEGPSRFVPPGPKEDAAPLDPVFWRGITGAHGELVAKLSLKYPIDGVLYDTEHYAGGMMYLQNCGFSDATLHAYLKSRRVNKRLEELPHGTRYDYLKASGLLPDYYHYLGEQAYEQGRLLANRWHAINPHLVFGIWPLLDSWFSQGFLRGLGGAVPSLGFSGVEYYHGAEQSRSMAEFFELRNANLVYMPGFYPPYAYTVEQLEQHVAVAIRDTGHYWMLGPQQELRIAEYQTALRTAFERETPPVASDLVPVDLHYRVQDEDGGPVLAVEMEDASFEETPLLSLWSTLGGAPLCVELPMTRTDQGEYQARVPLLRRLTNNRYLADGFRSGASYQFHPVPREFGYEDPHHTKLIDGRAYGYFGTTVAWSKDIEKAAVVFDLHRPYQIVKVELAQPRKLEDRRGGPTQLRLYVGHGEGNWQDSWPFEANFAVAGRNHPEPDSLTGGLDDPRHNRAWLSWTAKPTCKPARWWRIEMQRIGRNNSISLGEVAVWGIFDGDVEATVQLGGRRLKIDKGKRWTIPAGRRFKPQSS